MKMGVEIEKNETMDVIDKLHREFHTYDNQFPTRHYFIKFLLSLGIEQAIKHRNWVEGTEG